MSNFSFQVAICTYARAETLKKATLATLERAGVDNEQVTVFVPSEAQKNDYEGVLGKGNYRIVVTSPGQFRCRQMAHRYYVKQGLEGERLIQIDDDIWGFWELVDRPDTKAGKHAIRYTGTLENIARQGYGVAESLGTKLWGVSFAQNGFYMSNHASVGNMLVCGGFQGVYAGDDIFIGARRTYEESAEEDSETSCQAVIKYGKVARLQYFSLELRDISPGGIRSEVVDAGYVRTEQEAVIAREMTNVAAREIIAQRYPGLVEVVWMDKKNGFLGNGKQQALKYVRRGNTSIPRGVIEREFLKQG